jgi:hypothetical protein
MRKKDKYEKQCVTLDFNEMNNYKMSNNDIYHYTSKYIKPQFRHFTSILQLFHDSLITSQKRIDDDIDNPYLLVVIDNFQESEDKV